MDAGEIVELRDGIRALIRPISPADRHRLEEGFESSSQESRLMRFHAPLPRLSSRQLDYLTDVDHDRHEALIAVDPDTGESFGTARYVRSEDDPETAEFAVGVGDRWMRIGLGTALMQSLIRRARESGVTRFIAVVQAQNTAANALFAKMAGDYRSKSSGWGVNEIVVDLGCRPMGASGTSTELVGRGYEAWNRGDVDAVIDFLDPQIKWEGYTHIPESGTLNGRDEVRTWLERFLEAWEELEIEVSDLIESDDQVTAVVRFHGRGKGSGIEVDSGVDAHVWTVRDGKAVAVKLHQGTRALAR